MALEGILDPADIRGRCVVGDLSADRARSVLGRAAGIREAQALWRRLSSLRQHHPGRA